MKNTERALIVACTMSFLSSLWQIVSIFGAKSAFDRSTGLWMQSDMESQRLVAWQVEYFHHKVYSYAMASSWYFVIAFLLFFSIRRLKNFN